MMGTLDVLCRKKYFLLREVREEKEWLSRGNGG